MLSICTGEAWPSKMAEQTELFGAPLPPAKILCKNPSTQDFIEQNYTIENRVHSVQPCVELRALGVRGIGDSGAGLCRSLKPRSGDFADPPGELPKAGN